MVCGVEEYLFVGFEWVGVLYRVDYVGVRDLC